jgi:3-dehydroquinate synthase
MAPLLALAGFMGSGKSSVGTLTAQLLGWEFADLDDELVRREGVTIPDFFGSRGEAAFRHREVELLGELLHRQAGREEGLVLALGGGSLESPGAVDLLMARGGLVFLDVGEQRAWERSQGEARPLARNRETFSRLLTERRPTYERCADWIIPVGDRDAKEVATEIAGWVRALGAGWEQSWGLQLTSTSRRSTLVGGEGSLDALRSVAMKARSHGSRLFVVTDRHVDQAWGGAIADLLGLVEGEQPMLVLRAGEESKTVDNLARCWEWLASLGCRRDDVVVALGGGVVGDLAGFAAATYQRGVGLWQIPTSLLAQVDSSVGGKTAVNLAAGKNLAGAFYQPDLVFIDPDTLRTLPDQEFASGLGEVVKYGLLSGEDLFDTLEGNTSRFSARESGLLSEVVKACVRYKAAVVDEDERDTGRRAVLNLGHTTAHALEVTLGFGHLRHGDAVALGLLVALAVSERLLGLDATLRRRTQTLLTDLGLPTSVSLPPVGDILTAAARDKKVTAASAGFVGLCAIGQPVWGLAVPERVLAEALEVIRA